MTTYTVETIREKITSDKNWAMRAIVALYKYQTYQEQATDSTNDLNGVGFNAVDAYILSSFARQIMAGRQLSNRQLQISFKKLRKYAKQLSGIANQNQSPESTNNQSINGINDVSTIVDRYMDNSNDYSVEMSLVQHHLNLTIDQIPEKLTIDHNEYLHKNTFYREGDVLYFFYYCSRKNSTLRVFND